MESSLGSEQHHSTTKYDKKCELVPVMWKTYIHPEGDMHMNFCSHVYSSIVCFSVFEIRSAPPQQLLNETVTFMTPTELSVCKEKRLKKKKKKDE